MSGVLAEAVAQLICLVAFGLLALWYVAPWLAARNRADALVPLVWVHVARVLSLQAVGAQQDGFPISDVGLLTIIVGYLAGLGIALMTLFALRYRTHLAIPLAWALVVETVVNTVLIVRNGITDHTFGAARSVTWLVVCIYVPLLITSLALLIWQLVVRRGEPLGGKTREIELGTSEAGRSI
jgi:hypothetical protein